MIYIATNGYEILDISETVQMKIYTDEKAKKNKNDSCFLRNFIEKINRELLYNNLNVHYT